MLIIVLLAQIAARRASVSTIDRDYLRQLLTVRRVFVDRLNGGETAKQMRDMIINSLQNAQAVRRHRKPGRAPMSLCAGRQRTWYSPNSTGVG